MDNKKNWIEILYGPYFKVIGFFYRSYTTNRGRVKRLKEKTWVGDFLKIAMVVTLVVWLAIWFFASEESRNRLTEAVKQSLQSPEPPTDNKAK